jgi:hypothetical protein
MLPIFRIIWAKSDPSGAHNDHLHVEGIPYRTGTPPLNNPGMTASVETIYRALITQFGVPSYMSGGDWTHMGWYNRRKIAGTDIWSQHAWANAIDIGPYYGVAQQQRFYDFLTGEDMAILTDDEQRWLQDMIRRLNAMTPPSSSAFAEHAVLHIRNHPKTTGLSEADVKAIINDSQVVAPD